MVTPCPACPPIRTARIPIRPLCCDGCRARLRAQLADLPYLAAALVLHELEVDAAPNRAGRDPVAAELPAASIDSRKTERVSGSKEKPAPLNLNAVDLTAKARHGTVIDAYDDQIGHQAAATVLDLWMLAAREHRHVRGERLPDPTVPALVEWFLPRLDDLMDDFPAIGDMAGEVRVLRSAMRSQLGLIAYDDELKDGVVCPKCDSRAALHQANGSDRVECGVCGCLLTMDEFDRWVNLLAANLIWVRGRKCRRCDLERLYRVKGHDDIRCGWCDLIQEEAA